MESTIPQLVKSLDERGKHPNYGVSELLLSFVATFDHIPLQRRLELFQSLTNKIGPMDFLFVLIIILLDKYPGNKQVVHFAVNLIRRYDIETQFHVRPCFPQKYQRSDGYVVYRKVFKLCP